MSGQQGVDRGPRSERIVCERLKALVAGRRVTRDWARIVFAAGAAIAAIIKASAEVIRILA